MLASGEKLYVDVYKQPSLRLARAAISIGYDAWNKRFTERSQEQIRNVYDYRDPEAMLSRMQQAAAAGNFTAITATADDMEMSATIGIAWGSDDLPNNRFLRKIKNTVTRQKPDVRLSQLDVLPMYQNLRIGSTLVDRFLQEYDNDQQPTAYVCHEDTPALDWIRDRLEFQALSGPLVMHSLFGEDYDPVRRWPLRADSVSAVQQKLALKLTHPIADPSPFPNPLA